MRFTPEQRGFAEAVRAFCSKECGTSEQRAALTEGGSLADSPTLLRRFAELGWLGISLPAEHGGQGGTFVDECLFLEETARGLAPVTAYGTGLTAAPATTAWKPRSAKPSPRPSTAAPTRSSARSSAAAWAGERPPNSREVACDFGVSRAEWGARNPEIARKV